MKQKIYYASTNAFELKAIFEDSKQNRFFTREAAFKKMNEIKRYPISNPEKIQYDPENEIALWVKGYQVEDQRAEGYLGNFVKIAIEEYLFRERKHFKLVAELIPRELKYHPLRNVPEGQSRRMPNDGHPIIRDILSGREFDDKNEAVSFIEKLTDQFPTAQKIKGIEGIRCFIYSKNPENKRIQSWIFSAMQKDNGKYIIDSWKNDYAEVRKFKIFNYGFDLID